MRALDFDDLVAFPATHVPSSSFKVCFCFGELVAQLLQGFEVFEWGFEVGIRGSKMVDELLCSACWGAAVGGWSCRI